MGRVKHHCWPHTFCFGSTDIATHIQTFVNSPLLLLEEVKLQCLFSFVSIFPAESLSPPCATWTSAASLWTLKPARWRSRAVSGNGKQVFMFSRVWIQHVLPLLTNDVTRFSHIGSWAHTHIFFHFHFVDMSISFFLVLPLSQNVQFAHQISHEISDISRHNIPMAITVQWCLTFFYVLLNCASFIITTSNKVYTKSDRFSYFNFFPLQMRTQTTTWCCTGRKATNPWTRTTGYLCPSSSFRNFTPPPSWLSTAAQVCNPQHKYFLYI